MKLIIAACFIILLLLYHLHSYENPLSSSAKVYFMKNLSYVRKCQNESPPSAEAGKHLNEMPESKLPEFGKYEKNQYDYPDIEYPVPFNKLYNDISYRYENYGKPNPKLPSFVLTGDIPSSENFNSDLLVMTGASDNHAHGSFNLVYSALLTDPYASIMYIDLGLNDESLKYLKAHFETWKQIQNKMNSNGFLAYRRINWNNYPKWMHISNPSTRGGYSFKPIAIYDGYTQWRGLFTWQDGGSVFVSSFSQEFSYARRYGFYSPVSLGTIAEWTVPDTINFLESHKLVNKVNRNKRNCSGGIQYYDWSKQYTHEMVRLLTDCAFTQKCISPKKATKKNHRADQAVTSILIHHYQIPRSANPDYKLMPALRHESIDALQILQNLIIGFRHTYHINLSNSMYNFSDFKYGKAAYNHVTRSIDF